MAVTVEEKTDAGARQSNLAFSFLCLDKQRQEAMHIFYRFCRETDDIADDPDTADADKAAGLNLWRERIHRLYADNQADDYRLTRDLHSIIQRYAIPQQPLLDILDGLTMDIGFRRFATWQDLQQYCYGVASAVGLVCIRIFGCTSPHSEAFAINLGYALQFTNILRDVVEDYSVNKRIYLPTEELELFGVKDEDLANPAASEACRKLLRLQYVRARHFFSRARRLLDPQDKQPLRAALIMAHFYEEILEQIRKRDFALTSERVRLSKWRKLQLVRKALREAKRPGPPVRPPQTVTVVGAGIAGIAAATELVWQGDNVHLLEAKSFTGGRAHSLHDRPTGLTIDNGQHAIMGCYHALLHMVERLGSGDQLDRQDALCVPYVEAGGKRSPLRSSRAFGRLHLLIALLRFQPFGLRDRLAIIRLGLRLKICRPGADLTVSDWLRQEKQTERAIHCLWEPFTLAALNEPLGRASARLLHETLCRSLFGSVTDATLIFPKNCLSDLFEPSLRTLLQATGGSLQEKCPIRSIEHDGETVTALVDSRGQRIPVERVVFALNWSALATLLPADSDLRQRLQMLPSRPILNLHLLTDRKLIDDPYCGLLGSSFQWIFDRSAHLGTEERQQPGQRYLYALTMSVPGSWIDQPSDAIVQHARQELLRFFPQAGDFEILRSLVVKTKDATFSADPAFQHLRQDLHSPWRNAELAGDWTCPDLPATLEAAAASGLRAARTR